MKISILSDIHFGFGYGSDVEDDSFDNAEEAVEKALDSDLIILTGDIFDTRVPKTSVWARAIKTLVKPLLKENSGVKLIESTKELKEISRRTLNHIPVLALHGNHERRAKGEINAVEALENAGILIHLHLNTIIFEKDGVKVALHGMSSVPERFAKDTLQQWNPKPVENCYNILLLHQNIDPYVYSPLEPPSINLDNLPKGFDLIVNGHIHRNVFEKIGNSHFIIPGSTVITQMEKNEAATPKGIVKVNIENGIRVSFIPLENSRKFFYEEVEANSSKLISQQIEEKIDSALKSSFSKRPLIKIKIKAHESQVFDRELREIEKKYIDRAILSFVKELESMEITRKLEFLKNLRENKLSIEEIGLNILKQNLQEFSFGGSFDYDHLYKLLSEDETDRAFDILLGQQTTLANLVKA